MSPAPILLLAAAAAAPPICTDRPTRANAVCTVPDGKWQLETAAVDWLRIEQGSSETETLLLGSSLLKYGISSSSDLQVGFTPYVHNSVDGDRQTGIGDVSVRFKQRLTGVDSPVQAAVIPFVKLPAAKRGIGNGRVEGGVAFPVSFALVGRVAAAFGPEADLVADADGHGRHLAVVQLINLSAPVAPRLALIGELWANWNFDPADTVKQASADAALAYAVSPTLQLDAGVNVGLTDDTADIEISAGLAARF